MLSQSDIAPSALAGTALLSQVVKFKDRFYHNAGAHYDLALPGTFRLVPEVSKLRALERDYRDMRVMFFSEQPAWDSIISTLRGLEAQINNPEG